MPIRRFALGQQVRLKNRWGQSPKTPETFRITGLMPLRENAFQYRMRSDDERHERVAAEDNLEEVAAPPGGAIPQQ